MERSNTNIGRLDMEGKITPKINFLSIQRIPDGRELKFSLTYKVPSSGPDGKETSRASKSWDTSVKISPVSWVSKTLAVSKLLLITFAQQTGPVWYSPNKNGNTWPLSKKAILNQQRGLVATDLLCSLGQLTKPLWVFISFGTLFSLLTYYRDHVRLWPEILKQMPT